MRMKRARAAVLALAMGGSLTVAAAAPASAHTHGDPGAFPSLRRDLIASYDFDHPVRHDKAQERDLGRSGTPINLVNGGAAMRVRDHAYPGSRSALQTQQVSPGVTSNDDWKAGLYSETGVPSLHAFNGVKEVTIMGWFKQTGENPGRNSATGHYSAVGLAGVLTGTSQGHDVRALLEVIAVDGTLRVVALGRRVDGASSQTFAASDDWQSILRRDKWSFLAATFDFDNATMKLYKDGRPLAGSYVLPGDPWTVQGEPEPDLASASDPRGIKIGGSYPQNTKEGNPCNCRMDGLMFLDRALSDREVFKQYQWATRRH